MKWLCKQCFGDERQYAGDYCIFCKTNNTPSLADYPSLVVPTGQEYALLRVRKGDSNWTNFKRLHYVPGVSVIGRQLNYLVAYQDRVIGACTAGMSVYQVKARDTFFSINNKNRQDMLGQLVNNIFFRLDLHVDNLGTKVMKLWRNTVIKEWKEEYNLDVIGFETFVEPDADNGKTRNGAVYLADNWIYAGMTAGWEKTRKGVDGLWNVAPKWNKGSRKIIMCRWADNKRQSKVAKEMYPVL